MSSLVPWCSLWRPSSSPSLVGAGRSRTTRGIQGTWYIAGTQKTVDVTADGIKLADDVTYSYTIDEGAKTLSLSFGNHGRRGALSLLA